jgi:hypothetical protein
MRVPMLVGRLISMGIFGAGRAMNHFPKEAQVYRKAKVQRRPPRSSCPALAGEEVSGDVRN